MRIKCNPEEATIARVGEVEFIKNSANVWYNMSCPWMNESVLRAMGATFEKELEAPEQPSKSSVVEAEGYTLSFSDIGYPNEFIRGKFLVIPKDRAVSFYTTVNGEGVEIIDDCTVQQLKAQSGQRVRVIVVREEQ